MMTIMPLSPLMRYYYKKEYFSKDGQSYISYSILIREKFKVVKYVPDVFSNKADAKKFVALCNKYRLSPIHVDDLIEDFYV